MMAAYTNQEYADMLRLYYRCDNNEGRATQEYARQYPNRRHPDANVIRRLVIRLNEEGNLRPGPRHNADRPRDVEFDDDILDCVFNDPETSTRKIARQLDTNHVKVHRTIKCDNLHPYHFTRVQKLENHDYEQRLQFSHWLVNKAQINPRFERLILWTDESIFTREGIFNIHNNHQYAHQNPHVVHERNFQGRYSLNVWAGLIDNHMIGPHILPDRLTGALYLDFIQNELPGLLENVPLGVRRRMIYQHGGAGLHRAAMVVNCLNQRFPNRWIGNNSPWLAWPARSPDFNPLDYFLWGALKDVVYRTPVQDIVDLEERIFNATEATPPDMIRRATAQICARAQRCIEVEGGHFQQLLK